MRAALRCVAPLVLWLSSGCSGDPVYVDLSPVLEVWSEVEGEVIAAAEAVPVGPDRVARVFVGDGNRRLTFRKGADTVRTPPVIGPSVRLDPYLRAAGMAPTSLQVRTATVALEVGETVVAGGVVGGTRFWPAVRRSGIDVRWEAGTGAEGGVWVFVVRSAAGTLRLGRQAAGQPGETVTVTPGAPPTERIAVGVDSAEPAAVEVVLMIDGVVTALPVASGWASRGTAIESPAGFGPGVELVARLGGAESATAVLGEVFILPSERADVLLPEPGGTLEPMAPEPRPFPPDARPLEGEPGAIFWSPPPSSAFWGVALEDADGCVPGRHVAFERPETTSVERPELLRGSALLRGVVGAFTLGVSVEAFDAAPDVPPLLLGPVGFSGRAGYVRASTDGCGTPVVTAGTYAVLDADAAACSSSDGVATLFVDACGRTAAPPGLAPGEDGPERLRCGRLLATTFSDAASATYRVRSTTLPDGRDALRVDHPDGDRVLVRPAPVAEVAPPGLPRGRYRLGVVTSHLERPDFPGVPLLGTETRIDADAGSGEAILTAGGHLTLNWPGAARLGRVSTGETDAGPWPVRPWADACPDAPATARLARVAPRSAEQGADAVIEYLETASGPPILGGPTRRVVRARFRR
ncbi:hypothetical protein L6V77_08490 [Myxococcota bacterium]|nr:hypothetical protein [Myxococcota bacterium]